MATYAINEQFHGIEVSFDSKPAKAVLDALKSAGFRWHNVKRLWYAKQTDSRLQLVRSITDTATPAAPAKTAKTAPTAPATQAAKPCNMETMKTGDIVRISDTFIKNDSGLYLVTRSPGDPSWTGRDFCLYKIKRNGELSEAKYSCHFWPLTYFMNDRRKNAQAKEYDREHAKIEFATVASMDGARAYFKEQENSLREQAEREARLFGEDSEDAKREARTADFYKAVSERL